MTAREVAFDVVRRVFEQDAWADRALRFAADAAGLDARDRAFAMHLAYGTVQQARTLDHAIEALGRRPVRKLDAPVLAALRLGAYQVGFMGSVPEHAAANESVELVRRAGLERAVAFTNAVMRRLVAGMPALLAALPESTAGEAALKHSYPDWVAETWWRERGADESRALMRAQNEPPERCLRLNRRKVADLDDYPGGRDSDLPEARIVERIPDDWLQQGLAWPQSRGSQLAGLSVGAEDGERILDLCAAPGGKATQLAGRRGRRRATRGPSARAGGDRVAARRGERPRRLRRRARASVRPRRIRSSSRRRAVLRARDARLSPRPALASRAASRAPAGAAARRGRARAARRARSRTPSAR